MILTLTIVAPPQAGQVSMSMVNTRFKRCAQLMDARRSMGGLHPHNSEVAPESQFMASACAPHPYALAHPCRQEGTFL